MLGKLKSMGFADKVRSADLVDVYTIDADLSHDQLAKAASRLANDVIQTASVDSPQAPETFDFALEIGFLPGVTDNVGSTVAECVEDMLGIKLDPGRGAYSSQILFLKGTLSRSDAEEIAAGLSNPLIQRIAIKSLDEFKSGNGMGVSVPKVSLDAKPSADVVDILNAGDEELAAVGKQGIAGPDGIRRGPLALDLTYMKTIQAYFREKGRPPTDVELESIAQTWSEHCKHTIFADPMDQIKDGLFKTYIKKATERIRAAKGDKDFCVSVFTDNSGGIVYDDNWLITDKAETHNSPSALDPFGGAITGIVGVNRDTIGFGLGAKPVINKFGFCFADPKDEMPLFKGKGSAEKMLSPRRIMDGVVAGVKVGGNCSGIPTPQGFIRFDPRYKGKPLVFVGTVGLIPRASADRKAYEKRARPGDLIVMAGGRVGQDGIHGATFSSEALDSGSPATAVQIGDPITQKKMSDAIVTEARDRKLYNSITDNGAGGLSCSVAEMAKESGGCRVELEKVPLKYPGLEPWKIWVSESQERMTLAVPKDKWEEFSRLMQERKVEATVIGEYTDSGRCTVTCGGETVMDVDMDFLHNGLPPRPMQTTYTRPRRDDPLPNEPADLGDSLIGMLGRLNICGFDFISMQYDHEVRAGSVIKPLQGRGRINGEASVTKALVDSNRAVVLSQGINPAYSDLDTYHMAACAIDTAVRSAVAAGGDLDHLALLDNFCWCSADEPERLGQLKEAVRACHDYSISYGTPFISGKDSMFNDFKGFDSQGHPVKISVPPTLLVSSIGVMQDCRKAVSIDAKCPGDLIYILGETRDELGGSEYFAMAGEKERGEPYIGNGVPKVDAEKNLRLYRALQECISRELVASAIGLDRGGLGAALAKCALAGQLGMDVSLAGLPGRTGRDDFAFYSESQGRVLVTVAPANREAFEAALAGNAFALIGAVREDDEFKVQGRKGGQLAALKLGPMLEAYRAPLRGF